MKQQHLVALIDLVAIGVGYERAVSAEIDQYPVTGILPQLRRIAPAHGECRRGRVSERGGSLPDSRLGGARLFRFEAAPVLAAEFEEARGRADVLEHGVALLVFGDDPRARDIGEVALQFVQ